MKYFLIIFISLLISFVISTPVPNQQSITETAIRAQESTTEKLEDINESKDDEEENKSDEKEEKEDVDEEEDEHKHPFGKPINLMKFDEQENIIIDDDALNRTFMHPDVVDRKIIAVSIIGAFRKGKSFLMDYALRFMYANYKSVANPNNTLENKQNWIGNPEDPLKGFSWRGGSVRDTTGVILWSDVFLHERQDPKTKKVEKLAIILMDTQGLFDSSTSPTDNSRIFALGTLISSLQIFNLNDVIQENQLEYLQMATDFAKFAINKSKEGNKNAKLYKPFQTLIFLMRDWQNQEEHEYGPIGGANYLAKTLNILPGQPKVLQEVRQYIADSFEHRLCFLLPHPGPKAVNNKYYDGRYSELNEDFQVQLKSFLEWLLSHTNLKKKKILGNEVTGAEYLEYVNIYFNAFQSNEIPKVETLHGITVKKQYDIIMDESFTEYKNNFVPVEFKIGEQWKEVNVLDLEIKNSQKNAVKKAIQMFRKKKKLGNKNDEKKFEEDLRNRIQTFFIEWKSRQLEEYVKFKDLEIQKKRELDELNRQKDKDLRKMQEEADRIILEMEAQHRNKTEQLEGTIANVKNQTDQEMEILREKFKKDKEEAEKKQQELQTIFEAEKRKIQQAANERENGFKNRLAEMENDMKRREEEARRLIINKQAERLEALNKEAEIKRLEFERQIQIAENRELALQTQRQYEIEFKMKENRIRADKINEENERLRRLEEDRIKKNDLFQKELLESIEKTRREEQAAQRKRDEELRRLWMNSIWAATTTTTRRTTTYSPPKKQMSNTQAFFCGFTLGIACLF